jgi:hypothetical protein
MYENDYNELRIKINKRHIFIDKPLLLPLELEANDVCRVDIGMIIARCL